MDRLILSEAPLVPEVRLFLAVDAIVLWARLEAATRSVLAAPYWASAWAGGQALARYVLDHPSAVRGKRVVDLASGSGLAAIAAAQVGARASANDIDPLAVASIRINAEANDVHVTATEGDLRSRIADDVDVVLVGDALYNAELAAAVLPHLYAIAAGGRQVLIGDPGRGHLPEWGLRPLRTYRRPGIGVLSDDGIDEVGVYALAA
ncbi:MAG: methyltransferase [Hamadaea sp.]|nr:methyltransferase [Hamadaea sp.]